ncbi:MAG: PKD-like family lipoprotein [Muribaculaceae bacterium]
MKQLHQYMLAGALALLLTGVAACTDDKGNYNYEPKAELTIDLPTSITVLANAEYIDLKPVITSSTEGVITDDNPNFEYSFKCQDSNGNWQELNTEGKKDIYMLATLGIGKHVCWYSATDKRTGVRYSAVVDVKIVVSTSEGWMLLSETPDQTVRLDMISSLTIDRLMPVYDINLYTDIKPLHNARSLGTFYNARGTIGDKIVLMSEDNAYLLNNTYLTISGDAYELKTSHFVSLPDDHVVSFHVVPCNSFITADAVLAVSLEGNAFVWNPWDTGGGAFEEPINTSERAKEPEYRVSPYIGTSATRSTALAAYGAALLFDIDNHRFVAWDGDRIAALKQTLYPLTDPSNKLFSFNTGSMDLLAMVGTQFSNGAVYCFMQDGSKRHIYSINASDKTFKQEGCWNNVTKPDFDKATLFAAHSQYQTVYYAYQNKVYAYNLGSGVCNLALTLPANEEVTLIKFCTYDNPGGISTLTNKMDEETTNKFVARQYKLVVASYDNSVTDGNGGMVRFYETPSPGTSLTLSTEGEFSGFGRIKDIAYKEVRP